MRRCRACRHHAKVRALEAVLDGQVPRDHVDDRRGYEKRGDFLRAAGLEIGPVFRLDRREAAYAGAADDATPRRIDFREVDAGIRHRLAAGRHAVDHEIVHAARFLRRDVLAHFESVDLATYADRKSGDIEASDGSDAAAPTEDRVPRGWNGATYGRDDAESRDDDASLTQAAVPVRLWSGAR